jgi:hypothetical protein
MNDNLWTIINDLPKDELIDLIYEYDKYLEYARENDLFHTGWTPVCIAEFYDVEFSIVMEERVTRDQADDEGPAHPGWTTMPKVLDLETTYDEFTTIPPNTVIPGVGIVAPEESAEDDTIKGTSHPYGD